MEIKQVSDVLNAVGLTIPTLIGLIPNVENYKVVLFQPKGEIDASAAGVKNRDGQSAQTQFAAFLDLAVAREVDLAVTPEYSMPWKVLVTAIKNGISPTSGKLWALGCESISYDALEHLKAELADKVLVLFEALKADPTKFVDPLAYVFRAQSVGEDKTEKIVVLVQFKTTPMADNDHLELKHLQRGTRVYQFGNHGSNRLISFICSDVFGFTDGHAAAVYDRTLVIHIQLNPKPRETQYRQYREKLLGLSRDETELICLNWASDVSEWAGDKKTDWRNISGTAWYLRPDKFDSRDETLCANHKRGLYYTWLKTLRFHSLFFNYKPCIFFLDTSKVAHQAVPAVVSRRRGPQLTATFVWDFTNSSWAERASADDGFAAFLAEAGDAKVHVETVSADNPLRTERLLALSAGQIGSTDDWHSPGNLDSFAIDASEVIRRMTFCQDTDDGASKFRVARLKLCGRLMSILKVSDNLPQSLKDLVGDFHLDWTPQSPHQNVRSAGGEWATVVYMGEQASQNEIQAARSRLARFLHLYSNGPDESLRARQRLAVWFQDEGQLKLFDPHRNHQIDKPNGPDEFYIGRES